MQRGVSALRYIVVIIADKSIMIGFGRVAVTAVTAVIAVTVELAVFVVIDLVDDGAMRVTVVILSIHVTLVIYSSMFRFCSEKRCYSSRYCCSSIVIPMVCHFSG